MNVREELEDLCRRLKASDRSAFEQIFRIMRDDLLHYVQSFVRNGPTSHDLVQDVFLSLWGLRESLDPSQSLQAYLYRMARNRAYRHLRDERLHARKHDIIKYSLESGNSGTQKVEMTVDDDILNGKLNSWIRELPERQREALILSRYHNLTHREIAAVMGLSPRTVNVHIMRALENLHKRVQAFEPALLEQ